MKKVFLLSCLLLSALFSFAQETKKVAILEVVDRENKLTYSQKLVLRSNMAQAISNTPGFEAYDRSDIDAIMREQDFQRTGMVNEAEIRKLGEITGVSLILVTEAVIMETNKLFVSAKILNVETSKVDLSNNVIMGNTIEDMQQGCKALTKKMFTSAQSNKDFIIPLGNGHYEYNGEMMDKKKHALFLYENCPEAYKKYSSGKKIATAGWVLLGTGIGFLAGGAGLYHVGNTNFDSTGPYALMQDMGMSLMCVSGVLGATGIVLLPIGYLRQKNAYDVYNKKCSLSSASPIMFGLTSGPNGLGIAMQF